MISVVYLLLPAWSSHDLVRMRPSMYNWVPFFTNFSTTSAVFLQATMLCHSVFSRVSPLRSLYLSVVANVN